MAFTSAAFVGLALIIYGLAVWTGMIRDLFLDAKMALVLGAVIFMVGGGLHLVLGGKAGGSLSSLSPAKLLTHGVNRDDAAKAEASAYNTLSAAVGKERHYYRKTGHYLPQVKVNGRTVKLTVKQRGRHDVTISARSLGKAESLWVARLHKDTIVARACKGVSAVLFTSRCQNGHF